MPIITVERARPDDIAAVVALLGSHGLPDAQVADHLATAFVARRDGVVVGSAALEIYADGALLRSVAVARSCQGLGLGKRLAESAIELARTAGAPAVYLLTTTAQTYFPRLGFTRIARADVPSGVRQSVEFTAACPASAVVMRRALGIV
jgi:amino-acid N-acetyltransferase